MPLLPNVPHNNSWTVQMKLPPGVDQNNIPKDVQAKATVHENAFIDYNAIPPPGSFTPFIIFPNFYISQTLIRYPNAINTYSEVIMIQSGNSNVYKDFFWKYLYRERSMI
jgi:hypothetical protein